MISHMFISRLSELPPNLVTLHQIANSVLVIKLNKMGGLSVLFD